MQKARHGGSRVGATPALALAALALLCVLAPRPALAATQPVVQTPYAQQVLDALDTYLAAVSSQLTAAGSLGAPGFDSRQPAILGPAGEWLPLDLVVRGPDGRYTEHPSGDSLLSARDVTGALQGRPIFTRNGQLVVVAPLAAGGSGIGVAIPLSELGARLADFSQPGGAAIFDTSGNFVAGTGTLSADQRALLARYLPQAQGSLKLADLTQGANAAGNGMATFEVARSARDGLIVASRMVVAGAPEPTLPQGLFPAPEPKPVAASSRSGSLPYVNRRLLVPAALTLSGLLLGVIVLWGRRNRRTEGKPPAMAGVDYLDALTEEPDLEPRSARARRHRRKLAELTIAPEEPAEIEESVLQTEEPAEIEESVLQTEEPAEIEESVLQTEEPTKLETPVVKDEPPAGGADLDTSKPARRRKLQGLSLLWRKDPAPEPPVLPELAADPAEFARLIDAPPGDPETAASERASHIEAFHAQRNRDALRTARSNPPANARIERIELALPAAPDVKPDADIKRKTVLPGDVLVTKNEVQNLMGKEGERLFSRLSLLMRESEDRGSDAMADLRATFRELIEQFEGLQDNRKRDLTSIHDLKHEIENELATATLKVKQSEGKATEGLVRLSDRVEELSRKVEERICDQRMSEERLTGALAALRSGWESQADAQSDLRKGLHDAIDESQNALRRVENAIDREIAERKVDIERLNYEIKARQEAEREMTALGGRLDDLKAGQDTLHHRIDRTDLQQRQAIEALERRADPAEAIEGLKRQIGNDLEALERRLERGDGGISDVKAAVEKLQSDVHEEQAILLNQFYQEIDKAKAEAARQTTTYQEQVGELREENSRLEQRQYQMVQLLSNLHAAIGKSDARTAEEVERLKAQNTELQQMIVHLLRGAKPASPPQPTRTGPPAGPQVTPPPPPRPDGSLPLSAQGADARPIDLWGRLIGRTAAAEEESQRKRRPR